MNSSPMEKFVEKLLTSTMTEEELEDFNGRKEVINQNIEGFAKSIALSLEGVNDDDEKTYFIGFIINRFNQIVNGLHSIADENKKGDADEKL